MAEISKARAKKLKQRRQQIQESSEMSTMLFIKADTTIRVRCLPVDENEEFGMEVIQFYLGPDIKGVLSPHTFNQPCAIYEKWVELKNSKDADDKELAGKLKPKKKYVVPVIKFSDIKGTVVDEKVGVRLLMLTQTPYQEMIDYSLDPEHGDFTDPAEGYDFKVTRTGKGQFDTEYKAINCKPTRLPKKYNKIYNISELLQKEMPTYQETKGYLAKFMGEDAPSGEIKKKKKKKKKPSSDLG